MYAYVFILIYSIYIMKTFLVQQIDNYRDFMLSNFFIEILFELDFKGSIQEIRNIIRKFAINWRKSKALKEFRTLITSDEFKNLLSGKLESSKHQYEGIDINDFIKFLFFDENNVERFVSHISDSIDSILNASPDSVWVDMTNKLFSFSHWVSQVINEELIWFSWEYRQDSNSKFKVLLPWESEWFLSQQGFHQITQSTTHEEISFNISPSWREIIVDWQYLLTKQEVEKLVSEWKINLVKVSEIDGENKTDTAEINPRFTNINFLNFLSNGKLGGLFSVSIRASGKFNFENPVKTATFWWKNDKWEVWLISVFRDKCEATFTPLTDSGDKNFAQVVCV